MAKFAFVSDDGMDDKRYETLEEAIAAATEEVTGTPESEVEVVQILKRVSSELRVDVVDVE